jgi:hypothetical protein
MYIYVKNNINGDIKELFERIERVREEDLKVKFRELLFPFLFFPSFISPDFYCLMQRGKGRKVILN